MKLLYPGSFNPFHKGHRDIFEKASKLGEVTIASFVSIFKPINNGSVERMFGNKVKHVLFHGLLKDLIEKEKPDILVRGLRNGSDLQYEMNMQYWNEDLGIVIPTIYFICDRTLSHISSSNIKDIQRFGGNYV